MTADDESKDGSADGSEGGIEGSAASHCEKTGQDAGSRPQQPDLVRPPHSISHAVPVSEASAGADSTLDTHRLIRDEITRRLVPKIPAARLQDHLIGTVLDGRYEILEVIGSGGMSVVYKARQLVGDRLVAIKTLRVQLKGKRGAVERFDREIKTLRKLNHPNIVTLYDCVFSDNGQPFVIMDYLEGITLQDEINNEGALPPERAQRIFVQVAEALEHAHNNGIIHRDLKPDNIMLLNDAHDLVKILDFGLAKVAREGSKLTLPGEVWGSPPYMSPEQCLSNPIDERSDIYSLGVMMYEALTGRDPFAAKDSSEFMRKHVYDTAPSFRAANPELSIPASFEALVFKALEKKPDDRFQSMAAIKEALSQVFAGENGNVANAGTKSDSSSGIERTADTKATGKSSTFRSAMAGRLAMGLALAIVSAIAVTVAFRSFIHGANKPDEQRLAPPPAMTGGGNGIGPGLPAHEPAPGTAFDGHTLRSLPPADLTNATTSRGPSNP